MKIKESVIIVTGASAGIGQATAAALAAAGANVVISARRAERLAELVTEWQDLPGCRLAIAGNISDETFAHELVDQTVARFGRLDVLINNAGLGQNSFLSDIKSQDSRTILDTNVLGLLYATQAAIPHLKRQKQGQIINVSSIVGQRPLANSAMYCASKTAVNFLSRSLRMELRPYHIIVTLLYPGLTRTEFFQSRVGAADGRRFDWASVSSERVAQSIVKAIQHGRTEVYVTWYDWLFAHLNRLFPRTSDWVFARFS